jgi:hypothetical protein
MGPRTAGFRAVPEIRALNTLPIPTPAPESPTAAIPAPINLAAAIVYYKLFLRKSIITLRLV